jgi:hypothetical protein
VVYVVKWYCSTGNKFDRPMSEFSVAGSRNGVMSSVIGNSRATLFPTGYYAEVKTQDTHSKHTRREEWGTAFGTGTGAGASAFSTLKS